MSIGNESSVFEALGIDFFTEMTHKHWKKIN